MSLLPITPLSPEQSLNMMGQLYRLCAKQVSSYHKHHHMGSNSSVPVELAQELMASIMYTVDLAGGAFANQNIEEALKLGQEILERKVLKAKSMLELVCATAPQWQTECRWEALRSLRHCLEHYDHIHLAHKGPEVLFYPTLIQPPEDIRGIEECSFCLSCLWIENQIMASIQDNTLEPFWSRLPQDALNQCEYLLISCIGKVLISSDLSSLAFTPKEYARLIDALANATDEVLASATEALCHLLNLPDGHCHEYVKAVIPRIALWTGGNANDENISNLFV